MNYFSDSNILLEQAVKDGKNSCDVLTADNGCTAGCKAGFTFYRSTEYNHAGVHSDQEGFLVLDGHGKAKFGDTEFEIYSGMTMIAPAGTPHAFKKDKDSCDIKVFWFHSAV